jgi:hypothetical protein
LANAMNISVAMRARAISRLHWVEIIRTYLKIV